MEKIDVVICLLLAVLILVVMGLVAEQSRPDWSAEKTEVVIRTNLLYPSGRIIYSDDFSSPVVAWSLSGDLGYSAGLTTTYTFTPPSAMKLTTPATATKRARMIKIFGLATTKIIGIQTAFNLDGGGTNQLVFSMNRRATGIYWTGTITYDAVNEKWIYVDVDGNEQDVSGGSQNLSRGTGIYHFFKAIFDFEDGEYVGFYSDDTFYSMKGISLRKEVAGGSEQMTTAINLIATTNAAENVWIDNVTITEE